MDIIKRIAVLLIALPLTAQTPGEKAVLDDLERRAREALAAIPHARTAQEADKARSGLRLELENSLGFRRLGWPPQLRARSVGVVPRAGYRLEKIVYQSLPGTEVPAHLYIPDGLKERAPAILFYTGHWWADSKARPDFQAFCINMARLGLVVLSFDAFGQGERGISNRDHRRTEALLVGIAQQGFAEYETQCALEFLLSRPEVDPKRIGMTGASGGGYNTWMTTALDDRIRVAVPVVGTSEFYEQLSVCRPLDWYRANEHCHFVPNLIRYANNHELAAMAAPRPLLIVAASQDQSFPITGVREVAAYARSLYAAYGASEKFAFSEDSSTGHGYQQKKREAAYGWFLRWLMDRGDGRPFVEPPTETAPWDSAELRCFPPGENRPAGPGMIEAVRRLAKDLPPRRAKLALENGHDKLKLIPQRWWRPQGRAKGVVVAVDDRGKEALAAEPVVQALLKKGWAVCGVDPRGIGELATTKPGWVFAVSLLVGENFVQRQGGDLARTIDQAGATALYARGDNASLAATYALAERPKLRWFILRDGFLSFRQFFDRPESLKASFALQTEERFRTATYDREIPYHYFVFDGLRSFDLPQLLATSRAKGLVVNPIDGDWKPLGEAEARRLLPARVKLATGVTAETAVESFLDSAAGH